MAAGTTWGGARPLAELRAADIATADVVFEHGGHLYRSQGSDLASGGMGSVCLLERRPVHAPDGSYNEAVVGKTFHSKYLYQLRTDEVTRRDHATTLNAIEQIGAIDHPNLLPTYISEQIADNHLFVAPLKSDTLKQAVTKGTLTARRRVSLLIQALQGMAALHEHRLIHRDLTLRNILLDKRAKQAFLFDFDLALGLDDVAGVTYKTHYNGRIFGSPGFSVAPESIAPGLMDTVITQRLDLFAVGGALFSLFTDQTPYGPNEDMWALLVAIADGVVINGHSNVVYPDTVPKPLRPIIEACLERDPGNRAGSVSAIIHELQCLLPQLDDGRRDSSIFHSSVDLNPTKLAADIRLARIHAARTDRTVTKAMVDIVEEAVSRFGYQIELGLGRVKGHPIFLIVPNPELVASGKFPDANTFPKIVTAQSLTRVSNGQEVLDLWFGRYLPILHRVRQGLTTLYRALYDEPTSHLLLFSEFVSDPRFGTDLENQELSLREALGLAYVVTRQVACLHAEGLGHNNVHAGSLLFKRIKESRNVHPAMVGLVEPSLDPRAIVADVRQLAALTRSWLRRERIEAVEERSREGIAQLMEQLYAFAYDPATVDPHIGDLLAAITRGIAALDANFAVLAKNGGDLEDYALLLSSRALYGLLWPEEAAPQDDAPTIPEHILE